MDTRANEDFAELRRHMVAAQIAARGVNDARVLAAMGEVPREAFVPASMARRAYDDSALPIGAGQTISQPYVVALMLEAAELAPSQSVLDVGTGSGYAAAVLGRIAARVYTIERHAVLAESARKRFGRLGYGNIDLRIGDGSAGWPAAAPFDAIIVAAGAPRPPAALREQLAIDGRLVIPVGDEAASQRLLRIRRVAADRYEDEELAEVAFVPLIGAQAWPERGDGHGG